MYRCYGHHFCGSSLIWLEYFDYVIRCGPYPQVPYRFKKKKKKVPVFGLESRKPVRIRRSGRAGNRGVTAPVARNGLPSSRGTCGSSSMSRMIKSTGKTNFPTLTRTSSMTPSCFSIVLSAIWRVTVVGVSSPKLNLLAIDNGIKFILAPEKEPLNFKSFNGARNCETS